MTFDDCPTYADVSKGREGGKGVAGGGKKKHKHASMMVETTADEMAIYIKFYGRALCRECILPQ